MTGQSRQVAPPPSPDVVPAESKPPRRRSRRSIVGWVLAAVALVALGAVAALLWPSGGSHQAVVPPTTVAPRGGTATGPAGKVAANEALLATRAGFGAGVTGGADGEVVHVTTAADDGPGSLRQAAAGADPRWIDFDGDYTIALTRGIDVGSNKTIDGRGHKVTLTGHNQYGLVLTDSQNVIVENMVLTDFGDTARTKSNDKFDAIHVQHGTGVWIDHSDLSRAGDKLISVDAGTTAMTVSWNHFHDQEQVFQIGNQTTQVADADQTVTVHHNFFDHTAYRNPVVSYGRVHAYNNYVVGWQTYGMRAERKGQLYSEGDIFEATTNPNATKVLPAGDGCNDKGTKCDNNPGYLKSVGDRAVNGAKITTNDPDKVFDPHSLYAYRADRADDALKAKIIASAGWQPHG